MRYLNFLVILLGIGAGNACGGGFDGRDDDLGARGERLKVILKWTPTKGKTPKKPKADEETDVADSTTSSPVELYEGSSSIRRPDRTVVTE